MCPYFRKEFGETYDGIMYEREYCRHGGELIYIYCSGNFIYCPKLGGDDRCRRDDALTEEVSGCIAASFKSYVDEGARRLQELLMEAAEVIERTNYELLCSSYYEAGYHRIAPSVFGRYRNVVKSDMEREQTKILEADLQGALDDFEPADKLPRISVDGRFLQISDQDFHRLESIFSQADYVISGFEKRVDACGISVYEEIAGRVLRELADEICQYLRCFWEYFSENHKFFQNGINHAVHESEAGEHGFWGELPYWNRDIF